MSVANIIPEVWSALVKEELERAIVWRPLVEDLSGEITAGNRVHIPQMTAAFDENQLFTVLGTQNPGAFPGAPTKDADTPTAIGPTGGIFNYRRNQEIFYGLTATADIRLELSVEKGWAFRVDDLDEIQTRPDLMSRTISRAARAIGRQVNDSIRTAFTGSGDTRRNIGDQDGGSVPIVLPSSAYSITDVIYDKSDNNYKGFTLADESKVGGAVLAQLIQAKQHADDNFWPEDGRYVVMSPKSKNQLVHYLITEKPNLGAGMVIDNAFINGETPGRVLGFRGVVDPGIRGLPDFGAPAQALFDSLTTDYWYRDTSTTGVSAKSSASRIGQMYFGLMNDGLGFAAQVDKVEGIRLERYFADAVRGLYNYGRGWILPDRGYVSGFLVQVVA